MPQVLPAWSFAYCTDNQPSTPSLASHGTAMTAGVSSAKGSTASLIAAIGHDVHRLVIHVSNFNTSAVAQYGLMDIMTDPAGGTSWSAFISDLVIGFMANNSAAVNSGFWYDIPIFIRAGTSIGARAQTAHTVAPTGTRVSVWAYGEPSRPEMWWCGQGVETLGVTPGTSRGTSVPTANAAYGAWTNVGSATARRYGALLFGTNGISATANATDYHFQVGRGSQPLAGVPLLIRGMQTTEVGTAINPTGPHWCDVEAGAQLQVRGKGSNASFQSWDVALYGVY